MKHIWVVEVFGTRKWEPAGATPRAEAYLIESAAHESRDDLSRQSPGLQWRVVKYERVK